VELAAGTSERAKLVVGDQLVVTPGSSN
jgi:hypothetical protein